MKPDKRGKADGCRRWQLQDAKAQFSTVVDLAVGGEPQCVTRHGKEAVMIVSYSAFMESTKPPQTLRDFFRTAPPLEELDLERLPGPVRDVEL